MELQKQPAQRDDPQQPGPSAKRPATTPLQESRSVRLRNDTTETTLPTNINTEETEPSIEEPTPPEPDAENAPISNILFPTFKNLKRLNLKLTTAVHHHAILIGLKSNNLVPKGLRVKPATTTSELPSELYERWETAHIELSNALRDIMIDYWQGVVIQKEIDT